MSAVRVVVIAIFCVALLAGLGWGMWALMTAVLP